MGVSSVKGNKRGENVKPLFFSHAYIGCYTNGNRNRKGAKTVMEFMNQYIGKYILNRRFLMGAAVVLLLLSIICQIMIGVLYQNMIKQADNMAATTNKILKQCKLKFSNCYRVNMGAVNVSIFVDKFLNRIRIGRLSLASLGHLSGQFMLESVLVAGVGACKGIVDGMTLGELLPYYIVSLFGLYIYFSVTSLVDIAGKRRVLATSLVDYLENHMVNHLSIVKEQEIISKQDQESEQNGVAEQDRALEQKAEALFTSREEAELEQLIREFLT